MSVSYDKLWKMLVEMNMNRTELKEASGISFNVLARMGKNEPISFDSIEKICGTLNCDIGDIIEIDIPNRTINVKLSDEELASRPMQPLKRNRVVSKSLKAYAQSVSSADKGGVRII